MPDELADFVRELAADAMESPTGKALLAHRVRCGQIVAMAGDDLALRNEMLDHASKPAGEAELDERAKDRLSDEELEACHQAAALIVAAGILACAQRVVGALAAIHRPPYEADPETVAAVAAADPKWREVK